MATYEERLQLLNRFITPVLQDPEAQRLHQILLLETYPSEAKFLLRFPQCSSSSSGPPRPPESVGDEEVDLPKGGPVRLAFKTRRHFCFFLVDPFVVYSLYLYVCVKEVRLVIFKKIIIIICHNINLNR